MLVRAASTPTRADEEVLVELPRVPVVRPVVDSEKVTPRGEGDFLPPAVRALLERELASKRSHLAVLAREVQELEREAQELEEVLHPPVAKVKRRSTYKYDPIIAATITPEELAATGEDMERRRIAGDRRRLRRTG